MKLDNLTETERECYEAWDNGLADHWGGDCSTQGYAWAAFDDEQVIIIADDQGFVEATTWHADRSKDYEQAKADLIIQDDALFYEDENDDV